MTLKFYLTFMNSKCSAKSLSEGGFSA